MTALRLLPAALLWLGAAASAAPPPQPPSLAPMPGAGASLDPIAPVGEPAQAIDAGATTPPRWWTRFGCPALDMLVERALKGSEDIRQADAALTQARELAFAAGGALGPQVDASYSAQRARTSGSLAPPVTDANQLLYSLHTAQVTVSYPVDVFGGLHARRRSARAAAEAQQYRLFAARQTLVANLVNAVITHASLIEQIAATRAAIAANRDVLALLRQRLKLGAVGESDVVTQEAALAALEAGLPALERGEVRQRALIAIYLGLAPGSALPDLPGSDRLTLPDTLPVALPADVVRNRPDVRAVEAQARGAAADLGAAGAARLPSFTLSANAGGAAQDFASMFATGNPFYQLIGSITAPLFHSRTLLHQQRAARAALAQAQSQYRAVVLQAFADVSDALTGLRTDAETLSAAQRQADAAEKAYTFARRQLAIGEVGSFTLLNAQAVRQQAQVQLIQARAARLADTVALYQANGAAIP